MDLVARDALVSDVVRVTDEMRPMPPILTSQCVYAVFSADGKDEFLELVSNQDIAHNPPGRIFGDLLPVPPLPRLQEDAPLDQVFKTLEADGRFCLPVMSRAGGFLGAVTRWRILELLLERSRHLADALREERGRLRDWAGRLDELNHATCGLMKLATHAEGEENTLQYGLEILTSLVAARYGAVGLMDERGQLEKFLYTGVDEETAASIGRWPEGRGLLGVAIEENRALRLEDLRRDFRMAGFPPGHPEMRSLLAVPISDGGNVYGRLYFCDKIGAEAFSAEDEALAAMFAHNLALATLQARDYEKRCEAERKALGLLKENRLLTKRLFNTQEAERRSIARELHDQFGQYITAMKADMESICLLAKDQSKILRHAQHIGEALDHFYDVALQVMGRLRPPLLDELGLCESLRDAVAGFGASHPQIRCALTLAGELDDLDDTLNISVLRTVQECLTNVAKHASATSVEVRVCRRDACRCDEYFQYHRGAEDFVRVLVIDNGRGIAKTSRKGVGLVGMRERVGALNGRFILHSQSGQGLAVAIEMPVKGYA